MGKYTENSITATTNPINMMIMGVSSDTKVSIFAWVFVTSFVVWFAIKKTFGIRVSEEEEYEGVDISECGLEAYPEFTKAE